MNLKAERRLKRSADPIIALHYRLAAEKKAGALKAIVVSSREGSIVGACGSFPQCEELASIASAWRPGESRAMHTSFLEREISVHEVWPNTFLAARRGGPIASAGIAALSRSQRNADLESDLIAACEDVRRILADGETRH